MRWFYFLVSFLIYTTPSAAPQLSDYLTHDITTDHTAIFHQPISTINKISRIRLFFLKGHDCYSGYTADIHTHPADPEFPLTDAPFALNASTVYTAAALTLGESQTQTIHSILIRLITSTRPGYSQFAQFKGSCADQTINCCIPVTCSASTGLCLPTRDPGPQTIDWPVLSS